ncbi:SLC13 family permease [Promethearchaeum syntrophicum]|uniref:SLC13 family permease n=1 Tax=Promethearchaeum syntrophicum TaxID=2594042 RepID=A0A5B9DF51_9ARCH|nr:SLC13 family permease [Candidatus Prometheoarchaeum syntrophicum]QEE17356.1 Citrate transporter [Candidatus Prometheoarchaeum syntrophicum]
MVNFTLLGITLILFVGILIIFSREHMDYVAFSLLFAFVACVLTSFMIPIEQVGEHVPWVDSSQITGSTWMIIFINMIEFEPLLFIIGMQIICTIAEEYRLFQWVAVKSLHITKGNHRRFFYMICTIATLTAAIIADVTVAVIFVPLVIRACRILKINPAPYLYGITITINIGSILTPFSSSKNILISSEFGLGFTWFMQNMGLFIIFALISTLILLDFFVLRKYDPPEEERKQIFLDIMNPKLLISNRKRFIFNGVYVALIILGFMIFHEHSPLIAFFGAIIMSILNGIPVTDILKKIDLKVIFFFIALFLLIGSMELNGTFSLISTGLSIFNLSNIYVVSLGVLLISSLFSGFLASNPTAVLLIIILRNIYPGEIPNIILIAFLFGINLGGNLLPQGATCDLMTLNLAKKNNVQGFTYKSLLKTGGAFALIHIGMCILYLTLYSLFTG